MEFSNQAFERSHGRAPRGRGSWFFCTALSLDFDKHVAGKDFIQVSNATLVEAKRQARAWAKSQGIQVLFVQP